MSTYTVKEEGKNGTIEVQPDRIVRTIRKLIGRDDTQTIPLKSVTAIRHDRKMLGSDYVQLDAGIATYTWKVKDAESLVHEVQTLMFDVAG
jgi:hypothetical protein